MKLLLLFQIFYCFFAQFTFSSVFYILIPTLPIYLSRMGAKEAEIGVLVGAFSVSSLVFRPIVGKALLKIPERSFMIAGTLFFALSSVAYLFAPPFWPLLVVRIFQGVGLAFFSTASFTLLANITPEPIVGKSSVTSIYLSILLLLWPPTSECSSSTGLTFPLTLSSSSWSAPGCLYAAYSSPSNWKRFKAFP
jgi:MFS family permease